MNLYGSLLYNNINSIGVIIDIMNIVIEDERSYLM